MDYVTGKRNRLLERVAEHGETLKTVFNLPNDTDLIELREKLRRIERWAKKIGVDYCNGAITTQQYENACTRMEKQLDGILNYKAQKIPVFLNGDPRGYMLKIDDSYARKLFEAGVRIRTDFGGYGLIAPDFSGEW